MIQHRNDIKLRIPVGNDPVRQEMFTVEMLVPTALSPAEWDQFMSVLNAMRPALVLEPEVKEDSEPTIAVNNTGEPETVVTLAQSEAVRRHNERTSAAVMGSWADPWYDTQLLWKTDWRVGPAVFEGLSLRNDEEAKISIPLNADEVHPKEAHHWVMVPDSDGKAYTCGIGTCKAEMQIRKNPKV